MAFGVDWPGAVRFHCRLAQLPPWPSGFSIGRMLCASTPIPIIIWSINNALVLHQPCPFSPIQQHHPIRRVNTGSSQRRQAFIQYEVQEVGWAG
jgi:hypothetical protein